MNLEKLVNQSTRPNLWDFGNGVLYDLCESNPKHNKHSEVIAKVWLIGRSYAAAIERRKNKQEHANEDFYTEVVGPKIVESDIDKWLSELEVYTCISEDSLGKILEVHAKVTNLFKEISDMDKRSLASKYLHFHFPNLFFIYDSRAVQAISKLSDITGRVERSRYECADNEYRKLVEKCIMLRSHIKIEYGMELTPRQIDNILLS